MPSSDTSVCQLAVHHSAGYILSSCHANDNIWRDSGKKDQQHGGVVKQIAEAIAEALLLFAEVLVLIVVAAAVVFSAAGIVIVIVVIITIISSSF